MTTQYILNVVIYLINMRPAKWIKECRKIARIAASCGQNLVLSHHFMVNNASY
jgi:hypothetical protein